MKKSVFITTALAASAVLLLISSFKIKNKNIDVVKPFDPNRYMGKWYEIARLDYSWERDLDNVTATYSLREDGKIKVDNRGYNMKKNKWEESIGKAKSVAGSDEGRLEVSFFGPFYAPYNVVAIDDAYKHALVAGENTKYLWILSREKTIPDDIVNQYLEKAKLLGYKTEDLIWVKQDRE